LVEGLEGSAGAKARLVMILEVLAGRRAVAQACARLGLSERRFHALRRGALQAALGGLEPSPLGRPARAPADTDGRAAALEAEVRDLRLELRAAQVREEIALVLPDLLRRRAGGRKATPKRRGPDRKPPAAGAAPGGCAPSAQAARARPARGAARPASGGRGGASAGSAPAPSPSAAGPPATASP
jgi:hypothetical protein